MLHYQKLNKNDITPELFRAFHRRQIVTDCRRRENGQWVIRRDPFVDDWTADDYDTLVRCLKNTAATGGLVCAAFLDGALKGFVSVEAMPLGSAGQYLDLSSLHVSEELRRMGIGRALFSIAKDFARERGAKKLYISSHSAVESQAFYRSMGCVDALEPDAEHAKREPYDCQLECAL